MRKPLSITIITCNEADNLKRCLKSVQWADEIVVVDSGSTDSTVQVCAAFGCKVVESKWLGFGPTKHLAVDHTSYDWVFSIDSDEEVTPELQQQIESLLTGEQIYHAYRIKRSSFYLGKKIKHSGWDRDFPVRLFNKKYGQFNDKPVHESIKVPGEKGTLLGPLLHYTYPTVNIHIAKMNRYAELAANEAIERGKKNSLLGAICRGWAKFIKMYLLKLGFLDGMVGFVLAKNSAFGVYLKYLRIWQHSK